MVGDPISNMLIAIKNAGVVKKPTVSFGYSKIKLAIAKILEREGFVKKAEVKGKKNGKVIEVEMIYEKTGGPKVSGVKRISKQSKRVYKGYREIYKIKNGTGFAVYSTTRGLVTDTEARKAKLGGEVLFEIW